MLIDLKNYLPFIQKEINGNKEIIIEYNESENEIEFYKNGFFIFPKKYIGKIKINEKQITLILNKNNIKLSSEILNEYNLLIFINQSIKEILSN